MKEFDYAVVAVTPLLIMVLVGSLVLLLAGLLYDGPYPTRLNFIMCMFVLGIVACARVSIEEGMHRAVLLGGGLGFVVFLAILRFVPDGAVIATVLLAIVWWASTRLVYDCTIVDKSVDASKQGLMSWIRSEPTEPVETEGTKPIEPSVQGVTCHEQIEAPKSEWEKWEAWFNPTNTKFAPGAWVVYFSLAALPIFGLGQAFAGSLAPTSKWYLFQLAVAYSAAALCLLVTTSLIGLRRYLSSRGVEMPLSMTGTWLVVGFGLILVVLVASAILPRPNAEYQLAQLPFYQELNDQRKASRFATGRDGAKDNREDRSTTTEGKNKADQNSKQSDETRPDGSRPGEKTDPKAEQTKPGESNESSKQQSGSEENNQKKPSNGEPQNQQEGQDSDKNRSQNENTDQQRQQPSEQNGEQQKDPSQKQQDQQDPNQQDQQSSESKSDEQQPAEQQSEQRDNSQSQSQSKPQTQSAQSNPFRGFFSSLGSWIKLFVYAAVIFVVLFFAWQNQDAILKAWNEFWEKLFGRESSSEDAEADTPQESIEPHRPFASFPNPFNDPRWKKKPAEQWVRYSFAALEAWAYEQGCARRKDQTPEEFARTLELEFPEMEPLAKRLAQIYGQIAYGSGKADPATADVLRKLWQQLTLVAA